MFTLYIFCLAIGGGFVILSAFAGFDGVDFDAQFDPDIQLIEPAPSSQTRIPQRNLTIRQRWFSLPVFSLRFWTFGSCFFGLTGVLLTKINPLLSPLLILGIALTMGVGFGTTIVKILRHLQNQQANSLIQSQDLIGMWGTVEIPFDQTCKGKIRLTVKDSVLDIIAMTEENRTFAKGEQVFVVAMNKNKALVIAKETLNQN